MSNQSYKRTLGKGLASVIVAGGLALSGCSGNVVKSGHLFQEEDLAQVKQGMGKDQVVLALGTPDTQSAANGGVYYYISTTAVQRMAFMNPEVQDRRVVAIYFDKKDKVERIGNYGLKDGKVFDFNSRTTETYGRDQGLIKELFRNIGTAGPKVPGADK